MVWVCDEKRGTLRRKKGDMNRSIQGREMSKRRWLDKLKDDIKEKGLSWKKCIRPCYMVA